MVLDIRNGRQALEEARRRTAQVLATVATGVVAVDELLAVTMANPRAEELLGAALRPGAEVRRVTTAVWGAGGAGEGGGGGEGGGRWGPDHLKKKKKKRDEGVVR